MVVKKLEISGCQKKFEYAIDWNKNKSDICYAKFLQN